MMQSSPSISPLLQMQHLPLDQIIPDPNQPRHYFSEGDMHELAASIAINGVLQPILVRPIEGHKYMIVCGERRYRACVAVQAMHKERSTIPCTVRSLSDAEALELQIAENLQRKDIEPMEEAVAFKSLLDQRSFSIADLADKLGKNTRYVTLRVKLNDLIPEFKEMLSQNKLSLHNAYKICKQNEDTQKNLLHYILDRWAVKRDWRNTPDFSVGKLDAVIASENKRLVNARFSLTEAYPDFPVCAECPHNTANKPVLFHEYQEPTCINSACFTAKSAMFLNLMIERSRHDENIYLVAQNSSKFIDSESKKRMQQLLDDGFVILPLDRWESIDEPDPILPFEQWIEDEYWESPNSKDFDMNNARQEYAQYEQVLQKEWEDYQTEISAPDVKTGVVVSSWSSSSVGEIFKIRLVAAAEEQENAGSTDTLSDEPISKAEQNAREIQNKKLELNRFTANQKINAAKNELNKKLANIALENLQELDARRAYLESSALVVYLYLNPFSYAKAKDILLILGASEEDADNNNYSDPRSIQFLWALAQHVTPAQLNAIVRLCIVDMALGNTELKDGLQHPLMDYVQMMVQVELPVRYEDAFEKFEQESADIKAKYKITD